MNERASFTDPGGADDAVTVLWDFDYDGTNFKPAAVGLTPVHTFTRPGTFIVAMQAIDGGK